MAKCLLNKQNPVGRLIQITFWISLSTLIFVQVYCPYLLCFSFIDDALSQKTGYPDPQTDKWVEVEDAKPELMVPPDLDNFKVFS